MISILEKPANSSPGPDGAFMRRFVIKKEGTRASQTVRVFAWKLEDFDRVPSQLRKLAMFASFPLRQDTLKQADDPQVSHILQVWKAADIVTNIL